MRSIGFRALDRTMKLKLVQCYIDISNRFDSFRSYSDFLQPVSNSLDAYHSGHFAKTCLADVVIAFETVEVHFRKHVPKGIIGQTE